MKKYNYIIWKLLLPLVWYVRYMPIDFGKENINRFFLFPALPRTGEILIKYKKSLISIDAASSVARHTLLHGRFEDLEIATLLQHLPHEGTAIDVGAHNGLYTVACALQVGFKGAVYSFEPNIKSFLLLKKNIEANNLSQVYAYNSAVGKALGEMRLSTPEDSSLSKKINSFSDESYQTVSVVALDKVIFSQKIKKVSILKIDVEGEELSVLQGAKKIIHQHKPAILIEANTKKKYEVLKEFLSEYNYTAIQPRGFSPWNYLFIHRP